jgi:Lon protease-like protein
LLRLILEKAHKMKAPSPLGLPKSGRGMHGVLSILVLELLFWMVFWSTNNNNTASSFVLLPIPTTTKTVRTLPTILLPYRPSSPLLLSSSKSNNPNDLETPEEREERMKLVRKIQQAFYAGEGEDLVLPSKEDPTILTDVPLWRVQWVELPGYQNVLNVHVAHYTHMFRRILSGSKPWLFGHIYLPGGSENLDNPKYRLESRNSNSGGGSSGNNTDATYVGTLMQVSDYKYLDDGRLALIVQAMERFRVLEARQHVPYAIATIQRDPDLESSSSTVVPWSSTENKEKKYKDETPTTWAAVQQSNEWSDWEFRPTVWKEITAPESESRNTTTKNSVVGAATPLINYNAGYFPNELIHRPGGRVVEQSNAALMEQLRVERILKKLEYNVWCSLDTMLRLLVELDPGVRVPIPSQLLGLLPIQEEGDDDDNDSDCQWPPGFQLEDYAAQLQKNNAVIGTATKSPFLRVSENPSYPLSRRASRLSYAIWIILEAIVIPGGPTKQQILEERSIAKRLGMAQTSLDAVNAILRQSFKK